MSSIYLVNGDELVLEGVSPSVPIRPLAGSKLRYGANQTDEGLYYYKQVGATVEIDAGVTLNSNSCYFEDVELENNTVGPAYYIDTLNVTGVWNVGGWSGSTTNYAYATKNGLKIVSHRLLSDLVHGGDSTYSGKLLTARLWYDDNADTTTESYLDVPIITGFSSASDDNNDIVPYNFSSASDLVNSTDYDIITMNIQFIVPEAKYAYDGVNEVFKFLTTDEDILKIELLTENGTRFALCENTVSNAIFTIENDKRHHFSWDFVLGNDLVPQEWSAWKRSAITQYGLYLAGNRLLWDQNYSPVTTAPVGVQIHKYAEDQILDSSLDGFKCYWMDYSDSETWKVLTTSATLHEDDELMILAPNMFTTLYLDVDTAGAGDDYRVTFYYWNGSAWVRLVAISDGSDNFTQSGYIEFHAPYDWASTTDPVASSLSGYTIKAVVESTSISVQPIISLDSSFIYYAEVDTTDSSPGNLQSITKSDLPVPMISGSPRAIVSGSFNSDDIGRNYDSDGYLVSGNLKRIRGTSLTSYDSLTYTQHDAVYVAASVAGTDGSYYLEFPTATYELKPDILLLVRGNTDGEVLVINQEAFQVYEEGVNWKIYGISKADITQTYEVWYLPKYIDLSGESVYKIHSLFGPAQAYTRPSNTAYGFVNSDVFNKTPLDILDDIGNITNPNIRVGLQTQGGLYFTETLKSKEASPNIKYTAFGKSLTVPIRSEKLKFEDGKLRNHSSKTLEYAEQQFSYKDKEVDRSKTTIKAGGGHSLVFSYDHNNTWMASLLLFPNPTSAGDKNLKLDLAFSQMTMQNTLGADIYIWRSSEQGWVWEEIGSFTPQFGRDGVFFNRFDITPDSFTEDNVFYVLIVSKYPQFTRARGLIIPGDIPEEKLDLSYEEIYTQYNGSNTFTNGNLVYPVTFGANNGNFDILYARVLGIGMDGDGSLQRYTEGVDFRHDTTNERIELIDTGDVYTRLAAYNYPIRSKRSFHSPTIGFQVDEFFNIGETDYDNPGLLSNGEQIITDPASGSFNFKFALSRVPYLGRGMVSAIVEREQVETIGWQFVDVYWEGAIEYSEEDAYADTRIKSEENGHGRYVAHVKRTGGTENNFVHLGAGEYTPGKVTIIYPYLKDNYYESIHIEDVQDYAFSKTFFEHNSYHPSFQASNKDVLSIGTQIDINWPRDKEPSKTLEDE